MICRGRERGIRSASFESESAKAGAHLLILAATEDVDSVEHRHSLVPLHALHEANRILGQVGDIALLDVLGREAVVARLVAVILGERVVAKVAKDLDSAAVGIVHAVLHDAANVGAVVLLLLGRALAFVDESVDELGVAVGEVQDAGGGGSVSTGTTGFLVEVAASGSARRGASREDRTNLVVGLETLRERVMNDIANIGLVDTHSEAARSERGERVDRAGERVNSRDGGADDVKLARLPTFLDAQTVILVHSLMYEERLVSIINSRGDGQAQLTAW